MDFYRNETKVLTGALRVKTVLIYDRFCINVEKLISHHKHECNVAATKTSLMRMIVMKIRYFHEYPDILPEPMTH